MMQFKVMHIATRYIRNNIAIGTTDLPATPKGVGQSFGTGGSVRA